jgi:hypothetical protein
MPFPQRRDIWIALSASALTAAALVPVGWSIVESERERAWAAEQALEERVAQDRGLTAAEEAAQTKVMADADKLLRRLARENARTEEYLRRCREVAQLDK